MTITVVKKDTCTDQKQPDIHRDCLVLIINYLQENGFHNVAATLETSSKVNSKYTLADNIDLQLILSEFKTFYKLKRGKDPVLSKKREEATKKHKLPGRKSKALPKKSVLPALKEIKPNRDSLKEPLDLTIKNKAADEDVTFESIEKKIKPLPYFDDHEKHGMALLIHREILDASNSSVSWNEIVGLENAKRVLKEATEWPRKYPAIFRCPLMQPWKGALLFGLPGNGKTLLARGLAATTDSTLFNISAASITSKYRGDSEKLVRVLFELADYYCPSIVFIDEIDSIMGKRGNCKSSGLGEHEASRRIKTEFLVQLDGIKQTSDTFFLCASNMPWDLDAALLRRLEKRVLIPMPDLISRKKMLEKNLNLVTHTLSDEDFESIALSTKCYSGSDIKVLCKEVVMVQARRVVKKAEMLKNHESYIENYLKKDPVTKKDFIQALSYVRPSTDLNLSEQHSQWNQQFGSS
ncbi:hypothetical protein CTEN210_09195 [Chaetoceros tenuissimus]|uniref:AAA+ ATPase domain-containing protein n=1 Tax=Chaetoceros tenuissimus TaxID=426638 RepID=A0AAD3CVM8_9STRA|nr:hypothetical protein CTEN210_09195 [Chaetoceros tenuissimus]